MYLELFAVSAQLCLVYICLEKPIPVFQVQLLVDFAACSYANVKGREVHSKCQVSLPSLFHDSMSCRHRALCSITPAEVYLCCVTLRLPHPNVPICMCVLQVQQSLRDNSPVASKSRHTPLASLGCVSAHTSLLYTLQTFLEDYVCVHLLVLWLPHPNMLAFLISCRSSSL